MKHIINIDTWERKDNYNFFRGFANSWIAITSEADCTEAFARAKERGHSFFLYYLYAITRAVNEIKELRYRWDKNGQVVYHDTVDVITPIALLPYRDVHSTPCVFLIIPTLIRSIVKRGASSPQFLKTEIRMARTSKLRSKATLMYSCSVLHRSYISPPLPIPNNR